METFEFLNILQTHGFPKVMGVFTHLDQFQTAKNLRKTKKLLKHRFWTEIYEGAKMFYFSGVINGKYLKNEVKQLTLFISRVKVRAQRDKDQMKRINSRHVRGDDQAFGDFCRKHSDDTTK
jgi:ribosome biogenesis protein BMS1